MAEFLLGYVGDSLVGDIVPDEDEGAKITDEKKQFDFHSGYSFLIMYK